MVLWYPLKWGSAIDCGETSEETRRNWIHHCVVSLRVFAGVLVPPVSRSLAAYLNRRENMWASMRNDPATMAALKEKSGSFPRV